NLIIPRKTGAPAMQARPRKQTFVIVRLEVELQSKLNFASLARPRWFSEISIGVAWFGAHQAVCCGVKSYSIRRKSRIDVQELSVIQGVVELGPELNRHPFPRQWEVPIQRQVKVIDRRSLGHALCRITEAPRCGRKSKRSGVKPLVSGVGTVRVANKVRPVPVNADRVRQRDCQGQSRSVGIYACSFPAAQERFHQPALAIEEREFVNGIHAQDVRPI